LGARQGHTGHGGMAPTLISFVSRRHIRMETVASALPNGNWIKQISGGLTVPAIVEYLNVWDQVRNVQLADPDDRLVWRWTADGTRSAYKALHSASHPIPGCDRIWATWAPLRVKLFLWLAIRRRL